jgi:MFS superfamily sulfate permease-like transporter
LLTIPETIYRIFVPMDGSTHQMAAMLGIMTIAIIVLWKKFAPKQLKLIPGPLLGVALATLLVFIAGTVRSQSGDPATLNPTVATITHVAEVDQLSSKIPDDILTGITLPDLSKWMSAPLLSVLLSALAVALVASAETLLCATAVDKMHNGPRAKYDQELFAQGVGNSVCGLIGGIPMTGVIVRSAANVESGGKTRASSIMHGLWLLVMVAALPFVLKQIPISSLAAVLVFTGYKLVNLKVVKELRKFGWSEVFIYFATMVTIVATDLLIGVMTGIVLAALKLLYTFSHLEIRSETDGKQKRSSLYLNGTATFLRLPKLAAALEKVPDDHELHVHFERLNYIDHACLDLLMNWETQHQATGGSLVIDWDSLTAKFNGRPGADEHRSGKRAPSNAPSPNKRDRQPALVAAGQEDH